MGKTTYLNRILQRPASRARVMINGIGVYDRAPGDKIIGPITPINHWLIKGENIITIELLPEPRSLLTPDMDAWFKMQIVTAQDQENVLWQWEYPEDVLSLGLPIELPRVHEGMFLVLEDQPTPAFFKGTPEEFPVEGTPAQREAVRELYDAFASRDPARFEAAMEIKAGENDKFYEPSPLAKAEAMQRVNAPWIMEPFNEEDLRFDRYAGGRVAYVRRESGRPAVRAVHADEPYLGWGTNFYMTCIDGRWRIFW
jgi:hypothetical protein